MVKRFAVPALNIESLSYSAADHVITVSVPLEIFKSDVKDTAAAGEGKITIQAVAFHTNNLSVSVS